MYQAAGYNYSGRDYSNPPQYQARPDRIFRRAEYRQ